MAQRQEAHAFVALVLRHDLVVAADRVDQPAVAVHRALGPAGGARGVDEDGQVVGLPAVAALVEQARMCGIVRAAELAQRIEAHHHRVMEARQALHVEHDDVLQLRQRAIFRSKMECFFLSAINANAAAIVGDREGLSV